jgi:hypothetical protein
MWDGSAACCVVANNPINILHKFGIGTNEWKKSEADEASGCFGCEFN